ncbi:CHAT domain-containing protein [Oceaniglobus ichthyenteri]|uniref:CHAT domain-containing protein n=1 Tax=Oceaniglobus ichthyenteri TaxID=2136177 RepID=UPI0013DDC46D|nr:CHAT domain-containing protein [Oceaniglobus ichthyenteri]
MLRFLIPLFLMAFPLNAQTRAQVMDHVFVTAQRAGVTAASAALAQSATRIAAGSADLAALLRQQQDSGAELQMLTERLATVAENTGAAAETLQGELAQEIADIRARLRALDTRIGAKFPEFRELTNPAPLTIAQVQSVLDPDEALLFTFSDQYYTYSWAISPKNADWHRAEIDLSARNERVKTLRQQVSAQGGERAGVALNPGARPTGRAFDRTTAHEIYAQFFAPLEHVFGDAAHLMTVVDGPLTSLPLALLVRRPPMGGDDDPTALRTTDWLVRQHALTTLPNVSALRVLRFARGRLNTEDKDPFIGFGNPVLGYQLAQGPADASAPTVITRGVYEDVRRVADLAPLPNTARELRRLAATMGADPEAVYLAENATEAQVKDTDFSRVRVVAFATHGLLADGLPGLNEPALVFSIPDTPTERDDALLTASEAAQLKLAAELVILSACDTAGSDGTPGAEGLSGLARAFLYAGARAILVSHWPVDDFAASVLTTSMLDGMYGADSRPRAEALRAAMLTLLEDESETRFAHPRLWAPFVLVGEGGGDT